ncbi:hypothetical protein Q9R46_18265 [Paenibacillus sp. RRE4]|uniref:hypothetical protein n=1 Tax=Paenibacillus sp. RRE4 TaxID=2962587 RepID=UPI0028810F9C|nr:hypothetical protein [Paenibacillus sp. RRE4]MDT0124613.1 hypothetical protein [Paenibacillus sp. RRE4]
MKFRKMIPIFALIIVCLIIYIATLTQQSDSEIEGLPLNILKKDILSTQATKSTYTRTDKQVNIGSEQVHLDENTKTEIIKHLNSLTTGDVTNVNNTEGSVIFGIAFKFQNQSEIRVQYTSNDTYLTKIGKDTYRYKVQNKELSDILDTLSKD